MKRRVRIHTQKQTFKGNVCFAFTYMFSKARKPVLSDRLAGTKRPNLRPAGCPGGVNRICLGKKKQIEPVSSGSWVFRRSPSTAVARCHSSRRPVPLNRRRQLGRTVGGCTARPRTARDACVSYRCSVEVRPVSSFHVASGAIGFQRGRMTPAGRAYPGKQPRLRPLMLPRAAGDVCSPGGGGLAVKQRTKSSGVKFKLRCRAPLLLSVWS